jgi:hypothetical protein
MGSFSPQACSVGTPRPTRTREAGQRTNLDLRRLGKTTEEGRWVPGLSLAAP